MPISGSRKRAPAPWLRSFHEGDATQAQERRRIRPAELIAVLAVVAGVTAFFVWFLFLASGGPGPGTV